MAIRCSLDRIFGIRVRLKWDTRKKEIWFVPDEDDLKAVDIVDLLSYSAAVDCWSRDFLARHPGWKIDDENIQELEDVDAELVLPVQERQEDQAVLPGSVGASSADTGLPWFTGTFMAGE